MKKDFNDSFSEVYTKVESLMKIKLEQNLYDAIMVKKIPPTDAGKNNGSNQYHIAITGDGIGFFPLLYNNLYVVNNITHAKRYLLLEIPILIKKEVVSYLSLNQVLGNNDVNCHTCTVISRPNAPQVELGDEKKDSPNWKVFKEKIETDDFLIFIKRKGELFYDTFLIKKVDNSNLTPNVVTINFALPNNGTSRTLIDITGIVPSPSPNETLSSPRQIIFFGSPGTGKSTEVKKRTAGKNVTRTTFHPETDYQNFVGCYKPTMEGDKIRYEFVPQAFTNAYCNAWLTPTQNHYLVIEEINRGNCAQIFGDIFQCLDRNAQGFSEYAIDCSQELATHLQKKFAENPNAQANYLAHCGNYNKIILPNNLYIFATMNTSDQSLFPMDSAFKRRWDWEYVPINYKEAKNLIISIDEETEYNWGSFISIINPKIKELTGSEDKQLGNYFISPADKIISFEQFRSKVMFYLWSEVYKDEAGSQNSIFKSIIAENETKDFQFGELFSEIKEGITPQKLINGFMQFNGISNEKYKSIEFKA